MISIIYPVISSLVLNLFLVLLTPALLQLSLQNASQPTPSLSEKILTSNSASPSATPQVKKFAMKDAVVAQRIATPSPTATPAESYVIESVGEGFYKMSNVPEEPMTTLAELNTAVNQFRAAHGQGALGIDSHLCQFADQRAHEVKEDFSHDLFSKHIDEGIADGWGFRHFGENIWQGKFSGVHIVEYGWAKSPGHYAALVGDWTKGCGGVFEEQAVFIFAR